jgi:hypothetical protein
MATKTTENTDPTAMAVICDLTLLQYDLVQFDTSGIEI